MKSDLPLALIIEDDVYLAEIFSKALDSVGYYTEIHQDGVAGMIRLSETTPFLVTLDLHLPKASGRDILRYIKQEPHLAATRIILTTADSATAEMLRPQIDFVLLKPISFGQLRQLADRLRPQ